MNLATGNLAMSLTLPKLKPEETIDQKSHPSNSSSVTVDDPSIGSDITERSILKCLRHKTEHHIGGVFLNRAQS
jgi:hypothetical protein